MKKLLLISLILIISAALFGCAHTEDARVHIQSEKKPIVNGDRNQQKIIIMDNVNDPLPPEAKSVESMPNSSGPQQIPKANPNKPIVITKMPYSKKSKVKITELKVIQDNGEILLPDGHGCVKINDKKQSIKVSVLAKGLSPEKTYSITLERDNHGGVTFGPKENVEINAGEMIGETTFQPNAKGELSVSMLNPMRIVQGAKELRILIKSENEIKELIQTEPFTIQMDE
ncbi:hypothetical protein [Neobacillus sp.]|uniref:hypothetical protein n=1 Tax=Neobacillus sp. TaxID=2675273 RepID=UPI00289A7777|nr:hypothetical protein [Neobacillus sp.]